MRFISKIKARLETAPEVEVTIRPLSEGVRISLALETAADEVELEELRVEIEGLVRELLAPIAEAKSATDSDDPDAGRLRAELERRPEARRLGVAIAKAHAVQRSIHEALLRATLTKVEGMLVDGDPAGVEAFIEVAPVAVFAEVVALARNAVGLIANDRENAEPLSTIAA